MEFFRSNTGLLRDGTYWTDVEKCLELIELSSVK